MLHYISDLVFHVSQLIQTVDKEEKFTKGIETRSFSCALFFFIRFFLITATRFISNVFLVLSRLGSIILAVLTLWYGLALGDEHPLNYKDGYYNIPPIRLAILGGILVLQVYVTTSPTPLNLLYLIIPFIYSYLTFTIISQELKRSQESRAYITLPKVKSQKKEKPKKSKKAQEESDLPEVDQNTNKNLRSRAQKAK